jgi:tRNA nucleotidyltransferase/poly(A) polymerase
MGIMNIINLYENYNSYFSGDLEKYKPIFELCSKIAQENNFRLYLIGGIVRDMILGFDGLDIDITVEGDAIAFARVLESKKLAEIISVHKDFGTVKVKINNEQIDFASTRSEEYPKKGHLPNVVEVGCSLEKDVIRRDFTVNSMALSLNQDNFAHLIDYVDGIKDLRARKIRILHDKSFIDDPTRIIRGLKYASRLGFVLDEHTKKLQDEYLKNVNYDMCNKRVKNELRKTFSSNSQLAFDEFINQGIYRLVTKKIISVPDINIENLINKFKPKHPWLVYFGIVGIVEEAELLDNLELTKFEKSVVMDAKMLLRTDLHSDFDIYKACQSKALESLLIYACVADENRVLRYLNILKKVKLSITGNDIVNLGIEPSKAFSDVLDEVLKEKLANPKMTRNDELNIVCEYFKKNK